MKIQLEDKQLSNLVGGLLGTLIAATENPEQVRCCAAYIVSLDAFWTAFEKGAMVAAVEPLVQQALAKHNAEGN